MATLRRASAALLLLASCSGDPAGSSSPDAAAEADVMDDLTAPDASAPTPDVAAEAARPDVRVDAAPDVARDVPVTPRDVPDLEDGGITGPTFDYAITRLTIDGRTGTETPMPASATQGSTGFNVDGRATGPTSMGGEDCTLGDYFSTLDPDQNQGTCAAGSPRGGPACTGGVDNQLPVIADTVAGFGNDVRDVLDELVRTGQTAVVIRVSGVDGTPGPTLDDDRVTVRVYTVARPMFTQCARIGTPGQMYAVDDASLARPGDLAAAKYRFNGRIVRGRLRTFTTGSNSTADLALALPLGPVQATLDLFRVQLRFDMTADLGAGGNLGGTTPLRAVASALLPALPSGVSPAVVNALLQSFVDVRDPTGDPTGCAAPNGSISLGMGFTATRVTLAPTTVRGPVTGMCGS